MLLEAEPGPLVATAMVVAEAAYLICRQLGPTAETALYVAVIRRELVIEDLSVCDWARIEEFVGSSARWG